MWKRNKKNMTLVQLPSVGTFIDTSTLLTYPSKIGGNPDLYEGMAVHFDDMDLEWFNELAPKDNEILTMILVANGGPSK
jgi:hypothetical protein